MNSPTITMGKDAAIAVLEQYEAAAAKNPRQVHDLDRQIMAGYRALAKGVRLVDVNEAIKHGGLNVAGLPKLAIARAHVERTHWQPEYRWASGPTRMLTGGGVFNYNAARRRIEDDRVQWRLPPGSLNPASLQARSVEALTPLIPLPHRPRLNLSNYFLLWEANWHPAPPIDPYLLKPLCGPLMEIVAEWDVSPIELAAVRAAMTQR